jgi:hypothetical protein
MPTNLCYRPISTLDDPIIPIVLATLNVIIERANTGGDYQGSERQTGQVPEEEF